MRRSPWPFLVVAWSLTTLSVHAQTRDVTGGSFERITLGEQVADAESIFVLRVRKVDRTAGVITFRRGEILKGKERARNLRHAVEDDDPWLPVRAALLAWAEPGKEAVCFRSRDRCWVCTGGLWYEAATEGGNRWTGFSELRRRKTSYSGPVEKLRYHVADILAGKEVTVTARVPHEEIRPGDLPPQALRDWLPDYSPAWRVKASLAIRDVSDVNTEESRHFVGWGVGGKEVVPALVARLKDPDGRVRAGAAEELGQLGDQARDAVGALRAALEDRELAVRVLAARALRRVDPDERAAVPALVAALKEKDAGVRAAAAAVLGEQGRAGGAASGELLGAVRDDPDPVVRANAAAALGHVARDGGLDAEGREAAVAALARALHRDPERRVRAAAAGALLGFGPAAKAAVAELGAALGDQEEVATEAAEVLARLGPKGLPGLCAALRDPDYPERHLLAAYLGEMGPQAREAVPALRELLQAPKRGERLAAAEALLRIDPQEAKVVVPAYVQLLGEKQTPPHVRQTLIGQFGGLGPAARDAVPDLLAALRDKKSDLCGAAVEALGFIGGDASVGDALSETLTDAEPGMRVLAAEALWRVGRRREALAALVECLRGPEGWGRVAAVRALVRLGPDVAAALPDLQRLLRDRDTDCRADVALAVWCVGRREEVGDVVHDPRQEAVTVLIGMLRDPDPNSRCDAAVAVRQIGPGARRAVPALADALRDEDVSVRYWCARALASVGPEAAEAAPALTMLLKDDRRHVRVAAADALARLGRPSPEAVAYLTALLERHPAEAANVIPVLAEFGPAAKPAVPLLLRCLADDEGRVYRAAARALPRIDPEAARRVGLP